MKIKNTNNLINSANISVISSNGDEFSYKLALDLSRNFYSVQYYLPETIDEIIDTTRQFLKQNEIENHCKMNLIIFSFSKIASEFDCHRLTKTLVKLNELCKTENFKAIVLFTKNDIPLLERVYSNFTAEQKHQILMLSMSVKPPFALTIATGDHVGKSIIYDFVNNDLSFFEEK